MAFDSSAGVEVYGFDWADDEARQEAVVAAVAAAEVVEAGQYEWVAPLGLVDSKLVVADERFAGADVA